MTVDDRDLRRAIALVCERGFDVVNARGGFLARTDSPADGSTGVWIHQSADRSTYDCGHDRDQAIDSFLDEAGIRPG